MNFKLISILNLSGASHDGQPIPLINKPVSRELELFVCLPTLTLCTVPKVEFEDEPLPSQTTAPPPQSPTSPTTPTIPSARPSRLVRFLNDLALRPNDPPHDLNEPNFRSSTSGQGLSTGVSNASMASMQMTQTTRNPESDSFAYIETLLESLAVLGKLGSALDIVTQRLPGEIFNVVDHTRRSWREGRVRETRVNHYGRGYCQVGRSLHLRNGRRRSWCWCNQHRSCGSADWRFTQCIISQTGCIGINGKTSGS